MKILRFLVISTLATCHPVRAQTFVANEGYPAQALREGREGTTYIAVTVSTDGRVKDCTVVKSSGSADLDEATCRNFTAKARFRPATDADGNPIESTFSTQVKWEIR